MYLQSFDIRGFKSFARSQKMTLESGLNCIIGPPSCGKSALLEALLWSFGKLNSSAQDLYFKGTLSQQEALNILVELQLADVTSDHAPLNLACKASRHRPNAWWSVQGEERDISCWDSWIHQFLDLNSLKVAVERNPAGEIFFLDEVDQELCDDQFSEYMRLLNALSSMNQVIVATHRKMLMTSADLILGVTMEELGISRLVKM